MSQFKTLWLLAARGPLAIGAAISSVEHSGMVTCLERLWRLRLPAIFSILDEEYRRIIIWRWQCRRWFPSFKPASNQ